MEKELSRKTVSALLKKYQTALKSRDLERIQESFLRLLLWHVGCDDIKSIYQIICETYIKRTRDKKIPDISRVIIEILGKEFERRLVLEKTSVTEDAVTEDKFDDILTKLENTSKKYIGGELKDEEEFLWLYYELLLNIIFFKNRQSLLSWIDGVESYRKSEKYRKCVINAPMGMGKTYAIAEGLARSDKSAVIFMSDIPARDNMFRQINSLVPGQVWKIEGIDDENCLYKSAIYHSRDTRMDDKARICKSCESYKKGTCKTKNQKDEAYKYRILVTTHAQYDVFYERDYLYVYHDPKCGKIVTRSLFVIDEDIISKHFFECEEVTYKEFDEFYTLVNGYEGELTSGFKEKLGQLKRALIKAKCGSYIFPIDRNFVLKGHPDKKKLGHLCRKGIKGEMLTKKLTELVESAIANGCTYNEYGGERIYFNMSKRFPLNGDRPFHVFFDATYVPPKIMEMIFPGGKTGYMPLGVAPIGKLSVYHTYNSDLPRTCVPDFEDRLRIYCRNIMRKQGKKKARYFVVTTGGQGGKTGYENLVKRIFEERGIKVYQRDSRDKKGENMRNIQKHNHDYCVLRHFGDIRGVNEAKYCDVGILLGTYKMPEAVEVAWAIPMLKGCMPVAPFPGQDILIKIKDMKEHMRLSRDIAVQQYKDEFDFINEIVRWKRDTENEQAMGRPRFLFHDVDFYIVTKELINGYNIFRDKMAKQPIPDEEGLIIFDDRADSKYLFVKIAMDDILARVKEFTTEEVLTKSSEIAVQDFNESPPERNTTILPHIMRYSKEHKIRLHRVRKGNDFYWQIVK